MLSILKPITCPVMKPWKAEGISRTTWYERRKKKGRTGVWQRLVRSGHAVLSKSTKGSLRSPTPSRMVSEHGSSSTQLPEAPDPCPFFIPDHIPGAPNLIPYGRLISLAELRQAMGYRQ